MILRVQFCVPVENNTELLNTANYVITGPSSVIVTSVVVVNSQSVDLIINSVLLMNETYKISVSNITPESTTDYPTTNSLYFIGNISTFGLLSAEATDRNHISVVFNDTVSDTGLVTLSNYVIVGDSAVTPSTVTKTGTNSVEIEINEYSMVAVGNYSISAFNVMNSNNVTINTLYNSSAFIFVPHVYNWVQQLPVAAPSGREGSISVFDSTRNVVVLFGGYDSGGYDGETWEYNGVNWSQIITAHSPSARGWHNMAFDPVRGLTVLFGGDAGGWLNAETWEYDAAIPDWVQVVPATTTPSARYGHAMCFDENKSKTVMFGGQPAGLMLNDTWEWDGADWVHVIPATTSPAIRYSPKMVFDSDRGVIVLFSGRSDMNDTWEWSGTDWTEIVTATSPLAREGHGLIFDSFRNLVVLFGGQVPGIVYGDTWEYNGTTWTQKAPVDTPTPRVYPTLSFDSSRSRAVLFGGYDDVTDVDDTWEYLF